MWENFKIKIKIDLAACIKAFGELGMFGKISLILSALIIILIENMDTIGKKLGGVLISLLILVLIISIAYSIYSDSRLNSKNRKNAGENNQQADKNSPKKKKF